MKDYSFDTTHNILRAFFEVLSCLKKFKLHLMKKKLKMYVKFKLLTKNGCFDLEMIIRFISVDLQIINLDTTMLGSSQAVYLLI